ncbi:nuclear pore complex protein Nup153 isoform X2 [Nomia melanderi]|uniref:nuclear pore complex protein Nup153 isoform X2 n=1 Tax=Nomia melanderi TaxID=2448451 RepID=UPI0013046681|nr:nuclear pore complex protein Nup153 isoform X2 [Nomia melanderi]
MAKGNNNPSGRRSTSRNAKPYDANNSFVKKVATKVTDLIPQRSWISKWFNSSQNEDDILDDTENREEIESEEDIQKPPPLKRPCIRMDVTHPPGTFTIQPRTKAPLNQASPSKQQYSVHNVTSEDFSEPAMAGPSGVNCLVSSTPATQPDIRNIVPQRPELHSLVTATNNGTTNGIDDNSESSESTSGCSSLIPQTIRQEATSNVPYSSPFSNRKRFNNEKLTFNSNRYTMSSRRPSFNASVMTNTPDRASPLSSPFYSGNITFGGANAAGLYKQGRNLFISSNEVQLKVPRRTSVEVKPSNATGVDSSGMSQTAKKILEALEHFSSPITDAKKIPLNTSMSAKRAREETSPTVKVGLRHLTRQLTVPTVPDILKLRRRQKLQDTTLAARKIVSARSEPPPPQEYHLRTQDDEDSKHQGKLKVKMTNLDEEETVQPVNLPSIPLPISSLPNFNFTPSGNSKSVDKNFATKEETFTFASPIKITNVTNSLKSINNFTFSSPISADNQTIEKSNNSSLPTKRSNAKSATSSSNCVPSVTQNFVWSGSSTAPRPKDKSKSTEKFIPTVSSELKSGSVMDIFNSKSTRIEPEKANNIKPQSEDKGKEDKSVSSKSGVLQDSSTMWECSECLVKNNNFETQCFACKAAKPCLKNNKTCELPSTSSNASETKTTAVNDHFGSQFKLSSNQWECPSCYLRNKHTDNRCPACNAQKPDSEPSAGKIPNSNKNNVKDSEKFEGSSDCVLNNSANSTEHTSCNVSKSSLLKSSAKNDENIADDSNSLNNQKTNTSINTPLNNLAVNKNEIMDKFKPSKDTWECPCCMVRNAASVDTCPCCNTAKPSIGVPTKVPAPLVANGFGDKFKKPEGAWNCDTCMLQNEAKVTECVCCGGLKPGTKKVDNSITNTSSNLQFSFGIPATTGDFKFGIDKTDQQKTDNASSFKVVGLNSAGSTNQDGQFTFGIQKEDKKSTSEISKPENTTSTVANCFGFQTDAKSSEKIDAKQDSEKKDKKPVSTFSFGIPKTESTVASDKPSVTIPPSTTLPSTFTFGVSKSETKETDKDKGKEKQDSLFGNTVTQVSKSSTEIIDSSTAIKANTLTTISQNISQEIKPTAVFTFGVPSTTAVISNSISTSIVTSLPSSTQSSFAFSDTKPVQTSIPTFGQIATSIPASTSSNTFTFGDNKTTDKGLPPKSFSALSNDSSGSSIFSNVSTTPSLFGNTDAKTIPSFGTEEKKQPTFGASASKPSAFAIPDNKIPTFGTTESKPSIFGTSDTKLPVFGNADNKTTPLFNTNPQAPAATPAPTFNASSPTPALFGTFATPPVFGSNTSTTFNNDSKPNIFGSNSKQGETNTPSSNLFTFNSTPAQPVAQPGTGFNFSANTNPDNSAQKPLFTFGSSTTSPQGSNVFGSTFNKPAANTSGLAFDTPKPKIPTFGQSAVSNPIFGVPQSTTQNQPSSSFIPNSNAGFNFGSAAPATSSGGFNFGAVASTPASSTGFNFNPPGTTPTFDPNTPPSFNFTGGNAPVMFSGTPQAVTQRKIKKAFRRVR